MAFITDDQLKLLLDLTGIPTAAGKEHRVVSWIERWVKRRKNLRLRRDEHGNLLITQASGAKMVQAKPLFLTAHLDHPAFVVRKILTEKTVELEFRGGVRDECFPGKEIEIFDAEDQRHNGRIIGFENQDPFRIVTVQLRRNAPSIAPGDVARWRLRGRGAKPTAVKGMLYAPACDDLAGVAGALAVLDVLRRRKRFAHVAVLLTVAEEIGFVGAIGAAQGGSIPRDARLICLENSRSFQESPIGGGPILRVGDFTSVFTPTLTNLLSQILREHQANHPDFRWQRRLMPGGTCEATVFAEFGYTATCVCLALGNYHNMTDASLPEGTKPSGGIGPEFISLMDFAGLLEMLQLCIEKLDNPKVSLRKKLQQRFEKTKFVLYRD